MLHVVTGGSGSGKSAFAEEMIWELHQQHSRSQDGSINALKYIATMMPFGQETEKRIEKHRKARATKGFETVECYQNLEQMIAEKETVFKEADVLLECMSNLVANEMFAETTNASADELQSVEYGNCKNCERIVSKIVDGIKMLTGRCKSVVIVTNEVCSDGARDTKKMSEYKYVLGCVNQEMAKIADTVTEVVYGCPIKIKSQLDEERDQKQEASQKQEANQKQETHERKETMQMLIGGAYQGKTEYAKKQCPHGIWIDGSTCELDEIETCDGIYHFHEWIRRKMLAKENSNGFVNTAKESLTDSGKIEFVAGKIVENICEKNPSIIIVSDEVGYGLVPVDAFERAYREMTGRICTLLSQRAKSVKRVICGVAMEIK